MSNSRTTNYRSPTWPPDYSSYTEEAMGEEELVQILYNEANSSRAPDSYKKFISKLSEKMFELQIEVLDSKNQSKDYESKIKNTSIQCDTYADYLSTARENYDLLFEILQEERIQRMELEKKTMDLETEVEKLKNNNTQQQQKEANTNITTVITTTDQSSIPPSPSIVDPINVSQSSSSPQQQQQSPSLSQPIQSPQQPSSVITAPLNHDACHAQVKQYKDRIKDLERKMDRSATGRKNLEDQLVQYYKSMSMWETRAMDFDGENKRLQQLIQSKDMQLHDAQTQIHSLQSQLYNTQQHLRVIQQQHDQLSATSQQIVNNPQILKHLQLQHLRQLQQQQQQQQRQQQQQQQSPLFGSPTNNTTSDNNNNNNNNNSNNTQ